jgi:hypothetical protein
MLEGPITDYFEGADEIYLVRADAISPGGFYRSEIRFTVNQVLRGQPAKSVTLTQGDIDVREGSEFLILSSDASRHGQRGDTVGSLFKGNLGWQDAAVLRIDGQTYVFGFKFEKDNSVVVYDKIIDGRRYLTLDHVKALIKQDVGK